MSEEMKNMTELQEAPEESKTRAKKGKKEEEKPATVTIIVPEVPGDGIKTIDVYINGKKHAIKRNVAVKVPVEVAEVLSHSDVKFAQM